MIQVCSRCGTRWNVRDRQRSWCPRCQGTLFAPTADPAEQQWGQRPTAASGGAGGGATPPRLPPGYRWIAVRPGAAPPPRRGRQPLGPTPHYAVTPRWGLVDRVEGQFEEAHVSVARRGPSTGMVRTTVLAAAVLLGVAVIVHVVRYALLLINRSVLLNPLLAGAITWLGVAVSVLAMFAVIASAIVLTNWLIGRRAGAYAAGATTDPRSPLELRIGCLMPLANLVWAPVFVMELANVEGRVTRLRRSIVSWWCVWVLSTALMIWSVATSFTRDAQGIADNTVTTIIAYLAGLAALLLVSRVFLGFERTPVDRPAKRWVMVADDAAPTARDEERESAAPVESKQREPAA